jgi:hypothetical protein
MAVLKILNEHHILAIEEHIRVFFGLACKKNALNAVGEGTYALLAHYPKAPNKQNSTLPYLG